MKTLSPGPAGETVLLRLLRLLRGSDAGNGPPDLLRGETAVTSGDLDRPTRGVRLRRRLRSRGHHPSVRQATDTVPSLGVRATSYVDGTDPRRRRTGSKGPVAPFAP